MPVDGFISLAFGVSGLFTLIEQALAVYRHIDEARYFGENVWQQYVMFEHQYFRFESWQREMRSFQTMSLSPEHGQHQTQSSVLGADPNFAALGPSQQLCNIVAQISSILKAVDGLCQKYKVSDIAHSPLEMNKMKSHSIAGGVASTTIGGAIASDGKMAFGFHQKKLQEEYLRRQTSLVQRIRYGTKLWKDSDKNEFESLVSRFSQWNDALDTHLPSHRKMLLELISSSRLLVGEDASTDLQRVQVAASRGLYESLSRRAELKGRILSHIGPDEGKKPLEWITPDSAARGVSQSRIFGTFREQKNGQEPERVLIEWKSYANLKDYDSITEAESHVKQLVHALSLNKKPPLLSTLVSLGYFQDPEPERLLFGFISKIPSTASTLIPPKSLQDLLLDSRQPKRAYALPTLPQRIKIAQKLAITVLELHNAHWLHKNLHSDNVIFFISSSNAVSQDTDKTANIELTSPYVCGFEFARPDQVSAISFDVRKSNFNFYRHPSLFDVDANGKRPRYKKKHDIYSLGLLLLEIGLWQPLKVFYKEGSDMRDFEKKMRSLAMAELPHRVGEGYKDVVLRCLSGDGLDDDPQEGVGDGKGDVGLRSTEDPDLVKFYWLVVRELEKCHCT